MHQQLWGYKVEWKSVSRGTGGKKVDCHWSSLPQLRRTMRHLQTLRIRGWKLISKFITVEIFIKLHNKIN